jgi:hypothetical protein
MTNHINRSLFVFKLKELFLFVVLLSIAIPDLRAQDKPDRMLITKAAEFKISSAIGRLRAVPVQLKTQKAILLVYSEDEEVDPFEDMFFFPEHTLKLVLVTPQGKEIWRKEMNRGVIPGAWFCPVFPFDLNGDGTEEIWFVNNSGNKSGRWAIKMPTATLVKDFPHDPGFGVASRCPFPKYSSYTR